MNSITKKCNWCGQDKVLDDFGNDKSYKSGKKNTCLRCFAEYQRKWNKENPESYINSYKKSNKNAYKKDPKKHAEQGKKWAENNKEKYAEMIRKAHNKYVKAHPEKARELSRNRRALKLNSAGVITKEEELNLFAKYENKCLRCGKSCKLALDHVVPLSQGGSNTIDNAQPLCGSCNSFKGTKTIDYR